MPTTAPLVKVNKCRKLGANVVLKGDHIGEVFTYSILIFFIFGIIVVDLFSLCFIFIPFYINLCQ